MRIDRGFAPIDDREAAEPHPWQTEPTELLEASAVHWKRDWDAVALGFVLGVLVTLAARGAW